MSASKSLPNCRPRPVSGVYTPLSPRDSSARSSVRYTNELLEDMIEAEEQNKGAGARTSGKKVLPRPGPPPKRDLPPPPPSPLSPHDPPHECPRKRAETPGHRHSLGCPVGAPDPEPRPELSRSASEREDIRRKRRSREEWVRARKERDIQQIRMMMREKRLDGKLCGSGERNSRSWRETITPPSTPPLSQNPRPTTPTPAPAPSPTSITAPIPIPPSSSFTERACSTISALSTSTKEMELEERVLALERKNKMLEQTIMAVIRTGIGPSRRGSFLLQAKSLEEFLRELNLDE
ncbi:hypothetical protein C7212DRAFT_343182 [Tuber magnatum]|uniref:Uncharacterized protein n=1 Tax=Tuber magnatum TaxID=42249 RepID=A0A317SVM6_9PEZI|nr:hypothetical protein C7212DRAFT_343182 [Tuber magnatum]